MSNVIKQILGEFEAKTKDVRKSSPEISAVLSTESSESMTVAADLATLRNAADTATMSSESEDMGFDEHQLKAGTIGGAFAMDPSAQFSRKLDVPAGAIAPGAIGVDDAVTVSNEAFDGQAIASAAKFTFGFNLMSTRQSPLCELFFPTVVIDPNIAAAEVSVQIEQLVDNALRTNRTGATNFNKQPIVKALTSGSSRLEEDRNALTPILTASNTDVLLDSRSFTTESNGETVTTAPIRFGKDVNLLTASQSSTELARGVMDRTDAIGARVVLDRLWYEMSDGTDTESFIFDVKGFPYANFVDSRQDDSKDIELNFKTSSMRIGTSTTRQLDAGGVSSILAAVGANHTIVAKIKVVGDGNTEGGNIVLNQTAVELVEVLNAAGDALPTTDAAYVKAKVLIDSLTFVGATVEAYTTNSNNRNLGQIVAVSTLTQKYAIPTRSGVTVQRPTGKSGDDNDAAALGAQVKLAGFKTTLAGTRTLTEFADFMRIAAANGTGVVDQEVAGAGRHYVNPYYRGIDLDLLTKVDSLKGSERDADIQATIISNIKELVLTMIKESNYGVAVSASAPGMATKINVAIGTSDVIAGYLPSEFKINDNIEVEVASTPIDSMTGRIIVSFVVKNDKRNEEANPLNFGQMFWSPEVSYEATRSFGNATYDVLTTNPRFLHVVNLPVIAELTVSNLDAVSGKVAQNNKAV